MKKTLTWILYLIFFCNNFDANFYNMQQLTKLHGEMMIYKAEDTLQDSILRKVTVAEESLALKKGAEVMLLYNLSEKLKNGVRGKVLELCEDGPTVHFYQVGLVFKLMRCTWFAYKKGSSDVIGYRRQFPVKLAYGITVHKAQGQTLKAACIHSGKEFVPGQLYVACSRVSSIQGLSIVGFNEMKLIPSSTKVNDFFSYHNNDTPAVPSHSCCTQKTLCLDGINDLNYVVTSLSDNLDFDEKEMEEIDAICSSYFSDGVIAQQNETDLEEVLNDIISNLPDDQANLNDANPIFLLEQLKEQLNDDAVTSLNSKILDLIVHIHEGEKLPQLRLFVNIQQKRLYNVLSENSKRKRKDKSTKFNFRSLLSAEFTLCCSDDTEKEFCTVLDIPQSELSVEHSWVMTELIKAVRSDIIGQMYNLKFRSTGLNTSNTKAVWEMSKEGHGKVRYVGGWAIVKLMYCYKKYITTNLTSRNAHVRKEMHRRYIWINMLNSLLMQSANVHEYSKYKDSLEVIDTRQYRSNALVYVNDKTFEFFMELEQKRMNLMCHNNLNILKANMISFGFESVKCDNYLKQKWKNLFQDDEQKSSEFLYCKVVEKYYSMGAGQYIRDFKRDYNVTKTEAHRKRVQEKKIANEKKNEKISLELIKKDPSINKQDSHNQLLAMVTKNKDIFESTYTKKEIEVLCRGYGLKYVNSWTKKRLNQVLVEGIRTSSQLRNPNALL